MNRLHRTALITAAAAAICAGAALANGWYVSGQIQWQSQSDSRNGVLLEDPFTTGEGTPVYDAPVTYPARTRGHFETEFEPGIAGAVELGWDMKHPALRAGVEVAYESSDVETHRDLSVGGVPLGAADAAVLVTGATATGVTVADALAGTSGSVENVSGFLNGYYDFHTGTAFKPYVGAGIGATRTKVEYEASGLRIASDEETNFAYQVKAGASYQVSPSTELFGEVAWRASDNPEVNADFNTNSKIEIENERTLVGIGLRYRFGHH